MVRRPEKSRRGFTLLEMLVASAIAGVAIAAAFAFATFQMRGYSNQQDVQQMNSASRILLDTVIDDVRSAGMGTSFWAGTQHPTAFGGRGVVVAAGPLGVPSVLIADQVTGPAGPPGQGVMPGSDALMVLRVEGETTHLSASGAGNVGVPTQAGTGGYGVQDQAAIAQCANDPNDSFLVLISDMLRHGEPASILFQLAPVAAWGAAAADGSGPITFVNGTYGIDPNDAGTPGGAFPAGRVYGPGSLVQCVRIVTYWLDNQSRVRAWRSLPGAMAGTVDLAAGWPTDEVLPINPVADAVVADGVRDLQFEAFMSNISGQGPWAFDTAPNGGRLPTTRDIVETRGIRLSALLTTPRAAESRGGLTVPATIANHALTAADYPNTFTYRLVSYTAELRNLRHFDLMSNDTRLPNLIRSFPP